MYLVLGYVVKKNGFQFYDSTIKSDTGRVQGGAGSQFQFYDSTIKSCRTGMGHQPRREFQFYDSTIKRV